MRRSVAFASLLDELLSANALATAHVALKRRGDGAVVRACRAGPTPRR